MDENTKELMRRCGELAFSVRSMFLRNRNLTAAKAVKNLLDDIEEWQVLHPIDHEASSNRARIRSRPQAEESDHEEVVVVESEEHEEHEE